MTTPTQIPTNIFSPTPISPPPPEIVIANQVKNKANNLFNQLVLEYNRNYDSVWNNPLASPDKIVESFGTDAQKVFAASGGLAAYLNSLHPNAVVATMPTGWNYVANVNGSVTLTKTT